MKKDYSMKSNTDRSIQWFVVERCLCCLAILAVVLFSLPGTPLNAQRATFENPPINYLEAEVDDAVTRLIARLESGETKLKFESDHGYLKSLLKELEVPVSSQGLVFSKTSLQVHRISPQRPRAIYFNDDVYVGWCQRGDVIEIAATDSKQGPTFYTLEQSADQRPRLIRDKGQCTVCHASSRTQGVPGYLVRSVYPKRNGHPNFGSGTFTTDHTSPFEQRWGGWYVTGSHGDMTHMGNKIYEPNERNPKRKDGLNLKSLESLVSTRPYLAPDSDIVALMVLEHQTQMHNAITYAGFETRQAQHQCHEMNQVLGREAGFVSDSCQRRIEASVQRVVEHLLFCNEFKFSDVVKGTSSFAEEFQQRGKRDRQGRSLRQLDLKTRLFKYPCSYLIYSQSFDGLPDIVRTRVLQQLKQVLTTDKPQPDKRFAHLTPESRQAIDEILMGTKPEYQALSAQRDAAATQ